MEQTFGSFVRQMRIARGLSLRGLAARLNLSPVYMSNIETDRRAAPTQEYLDKLIFELGLNKEEQEHLLDLAAKSKTQRVSADLPDYIMERDIVRPPCAPPKRWTPRTRSGRSSLTALQSESRNREGGKHMRKLYYREQALESIARKVLCEFDPALYYGAPTAVPIEAIIEAHGISLEYQYLRKNGRILGKTIFDNGLEAVYDMENREYVLFPVEAGTILIDASLCMEEAGTGRLRFTCAP